VTTVVLQYDSSTGALEDASGMALGNWFGVVSLEPQTEPVSIRDLVMLKEAGYTTTDIIDLSQNGLLGKIS